VTRTVLEDAFDHHVWATLQLIDACLALTPEQLETTVPGTFGSILATIRHTVGADSSYCALLSDGRVAQVDEDALGLSELRAAMERNGPVWNDLVAGDLDPDRTIVRRRDDGSTSTASLGVRVAQVIHHGTDHRSQVCTALTSLGIEPPPIDVWDYGETRGRLAATPATAAAE
jgi:uncharacterized damage-inducible protein DinB